MAADGEGATGLARQGVFAAKHTFTELLDWFVDYIGPVVLFLIGLFSYSSIGGAGIVYNVMINQLKLSPAVASHAAPLLPAALMGVLGGAFWTLGRSDGILTRLVGKFVGAWAFGATAGYVLLAVFPQPAPDGLIDRLINGGTI